jgi:hypothetical protein
VTKISKENVFCLGDQLLTALATIFFPSWGPGNKRNKRKEKGRIFGHGCCGKDALAIGGATAADMAIVASAFNSDHPN